MGMRLHLSRTRDQVQQYGYAAFGLTVVPYALMSIINLLGNLMLPGYPVRILVEPSDSVALYESLGTATEAIPINIAPENRRKSNHSKSRPIYHTSGFITLFVGLIPLAIVGVLSGFEPTRALCWSAAFCWLGWFGAWSRAPRLNPCSATSDSSLG
jgi:hypothetical protein